MSEIIDLTGVEHHRAVKELTQVLCSKTQNPDEGFYRCEVAYFLGKMASMQRATLATKDRGKIPVNIYAMALATSGYGKGHSVGIMENEVLLGFQRRFMDDTFKELSEYNLDKLANERSAQNSSDFDDEKQALDKQFKAAGSYPFTFDSGTPPAVKQLRQKLLLADCGAINLQIDEIGSNLVGSTDVLTLFLELYDQGMVKTKLVKNTSENQRGDDMHGKTPTNMLLFGTPSKLFDSGQTEDQFFSMLDTGYARRCIYGYGTITKKAGEDDPVELYKKLANPNTEATIKKWNTYFHGLADGGMHNWEMIVGETVGIQLLTYKIKCEEAALNLPEHEEIRKAELSHRYFKALKLAGAYAFVDKSSEVEMTHLMSAILLVEQSGKAFEQIMKREKNYVKLAKYIAATEIDLTHHDLKDALPFYPTGQSARNEMLSLAQAYGYKNHIVIKKSFVDGIELFRGESLKATNLNEIMISYSDHWANNYNCEKVPWNQLNILTQQPNLHWANHHLEGGHRAEANVIDGFNIIVIDVDEGITLDQVHDLLKEYTFMTYTTKRHQTEGHGDRFRLIFPSNYILKLDQEDYREFMNNFMAWLPFPADEASNQRSKKWQTHDGQFHFNEGQLVDVRDFIPRTSRQEARTKELQSLGSLDSLERWFAGKIAVGNRNNNMLKFAMALADSGMSLTEVIARTEHFNASLGNSLSDDELQKTVLRSVAKKFEDMK